MAVYANLAELKARLNITDDRDDLVLTDALTSASRWIDGVCDQTFAVSTTATAQDFHACDYYHLDVPPIGSTTDLVVATDASGDGTFETTLVVGTDFQLLPVNAAAASPEAKPWTALRRLSGTWPVAWGYFNRRERVRVTARWGWPAVPHNVKQACLELAAETFRLKDAPFGIAGVNDFGPLRVGRQTADRAMSLLAVYGAGRQLIA